MYLFIYLFISFVSYLFVLFYTSLIYISLHFFPSSSFYFLFINLFYLSYLFYVFSYLSHSMFLFQQVGTIKFLAVDFNESALISRENKLYIKIVSYERMRQMTKQEIKCAVIIII